ncbi:lipid asymmetry maintenance protein MlaB [Streptomyces sp. NPDC060194]|uniref:STAS domain-containing protein n=1 Tax=Streptomyces sp. NPDC060194 TaxID=3347069 RepID=UPI003663D0FD
MVNVVNVAIRESVRGPCAELTGVLAFDTVPSADRAVGELDAGPGEVWTADLSGLNLCDSSGIAFLLELRRRARSAGTDLVLAAVPEHLGRYLDLLGLDEVFTLAPTAPAHAVPNSPEVTPIDALSSRRTPAPHPAADVAFTPDAAGEAGA